MVRLIPRDTKFVEMFRGMADNLMVGARLLLETLQHYSDLEERVLKIKAIEHRGDEITHEIMVALNQTFITPFDREDIHKLATSLDDVLDFILGAAERLLNYKIAVPPVAAAVLATIIIRQTEELAAALSKLGKNQEMMRHCVEINRLENEADQVERRAVASLFENEKDCIQLIKFKELIEVLEKATDKAEDAANVLESIAVKSA
ncbi:MAG: DUF47 domain-containing protein [Terriglobales bacterium]